MYLFLLTVYNEIGVVIIALSGKDRGIVESLRQSIQMDLADQCGLVPIIMQQFWKTFLIPVELLYIVYLAIYKAVLARKHNCPTGCTKGIRDSGP